MLLLVWITFSRGAICKYWIYVKEDTSSIDRSNKSELLQKTGISVVLSIIHNPSKPRKVPPFLRHSLTKNW